MTTGGVNRSKNVRSLGPRYTQTRERAELCLMFGTTEEKLSPTRQFKGQSLAKETITNHLPQTDGPSKVKGGKH